MSTKQESKTTVSHLPEHGPIDENGREILLQVKNVDITFGKGDDAVKAVKNASFDIYKGETFSLVGESGSGKTTIGRAVIRVNPCSAGEILYKGVKISGKIPHSLDREVIRNIQMVFQDPYASLDPRMTVGDIVGEAIDIHKLAANKKERHDRIISMLEKVGLNSEHANRYPHEFSGGQRQRVAIARALAPKPKVLIADEPVSMLDVSLRLGVLNLLSRIQQEEHIGMLYITHDLATARHFSDEIMVMCHGDIIEHGPSDDVILNPQQDYTKVLLNAAPDPEKHFAKIRDERSRQ